MTVCYLISYSCFVHVTFVMKTTGQHLIKCKTVCIKTPCEEALLPCSPGKVEQKMWGAELGISVPEGMKSVNKLCESYKAIFLTREGSQTKVDCIHF